MALTKKQFKQHLLNELDRLWRDAQDRIDHITPLASNPQVKMMIERNQAYKRALEDVNNFIHINR